MEKDFKIGLVCGLIPASVVLIWVATRPSLRPEARMARSAQVALQGNLAPARSAPTTDSVVGPRSSTLPSPSSPGPNPALPAQSPVEVSAMQKPLSELLAGSTPAAERPNEPDMTIYEQAEKIKTTRFHIVRKDETLSTISQQYYGSPNRWRHILEANKDTIPDANKIRPGTKLTIPE